MYGVLWRSKNLLDGESEYLMYKDGLPLIFVTKKKATEWIRNNYGFIAWEKICDKSRTAGECRRRCGLLI